MEQKLICYTLVDITKTGIIHQTDTKERNQQRNLETVLQTIGIRAQPFNNTIPMKTVMPMQNMKFGSIFGEKQQIWTFEFTIEHTDVFLLNGNHIGQLDYDFDNIPVILSLDETVIFAQSAFSTANTTRNIYFELHGVN